MVQGKGAEMEDLAEEEQSTVNYYALIKRYLKKQYPHLGERDMRGVCRMVIFGSETDDIDMPDVPETVAEVRKSLANFIEREASVKSFIPYSIDAELADLIEDNTRENSSMDEYYRWVHVVMDILEHTSDGVVTRDDAAERRIFISMSYDREALLMLCLALYQGAKGEQLEDRLDLLMFKLERLRELRNIVFKASRVIASQKRGGKDQLRQYYEYCQMLLKQNMRDISKFRLKLKLKKYDNTKDEDFEDDVFFLEHLRKVIGRMLWHRRKLFLQSQQTDVHTNEITPAELVLMSLNRDANGK